MEESGGGIIEVFIHSSMALGSFVGPWSLLQFRNLFYTDGRTPWMSEYRYYYGIFLDRPRTNTKNLIRDIRNRPRFELAPPEYKSRSLPLHQSDRCYIISFSIFSYF
jgi:hypothetical protein